MFIVQTKEEIQKLESIWEEYGCSLLMIDGLGAQKCPSPTLWCIVQGRLYFFLIQYMPSEKKRIIDT